MKSTFHGFVFHIYLEMLEVNSISSMCVCAVFEASRMQNDAF